VHEKRTGEDGPGNPSGRHCRQGEHEHAEGAKCRENKSRSGACRLRLGREPSARNRRKRCSRNGGDRFRARCSLDALRLHPRPRRPRLLSRRLSGALRSSRTRSLLRRRLARDGWERSGCDRRRRRRWRWRRRWRGRRWWWRRGWSWPGVRLGRRRLRVGGRRRARGARVTRHGGQRRHRLGQPRQAPKNKGTEAGKEGGRRHPERSRARRAGAGSRSHRTLKSRVGPLGPSGIRIARSAYLIYELPTVARLRYFARRANLGHPPYRQRASAGARES
jgi:hypothetical protein